MAKSLFDDPLSRRRPVPRPQADRTSAREIVRAVRRGERNPFRQGSPEGIAWAFTEQLKRHAGAGRSPLAATARKALDSHDPQPPRDAPPVPGLRPLPPGVERAPLPSERPAEVPAKPMWSEHQIVPVSVDYADAIARAEKSADYRAMRYTTSGTPVAFGRYQLQRDGLVDIKLMTPDGRWNPETGVRTLEDFLGNPALQDAAFEAYLETMRGYLSNVRGQNAFDHLGQRIQGLKANFLVTEGGLLAAAHREGQGNVMGYLNFQKAQGWVSDFSELSADDRGLYQRIETRLRMFSAVPLGPDHLAPALVPDMPTLPTP